MAKKTDKVNLDENLSKLSAIAKWFDDQTGIKVEEGLEKVKEAAVLVKESRKRLKEVENEFEELKIVFDDDSYDDFNSSAIVRQSKMHRPPEDNDDVPF